MEDARLGGKLLQFFLPLETRAVGYYLWPKILCEQGMMPGSPGLHSWLSKISAFVKNIPQGLQFCLSFGFADDFKSITSSKQELEVCVNGIKTWCDKSKTALNSRIRHLLNIKSNLQASVYEEEVACKPSQKDFSSFFAGSLSWKESSNQMTKKGIVALHQLEGNLLNMCKLNACLKSYFGYVIPVTVSSSQA